MTRSGFEPSFLRVNLCCEVRLGLAAWGGGLGIMFRVCSRNSVRLVEFGSGVIQVEGLQYVRRLVVRSWFLKSNCFFMVWVRRFADFRMRWCVEAGVLGQSWDLRQVLWYQWGLVGGKRDCLWLYFWSLFGVLGGSGAWCFWSFSLGVFAGRVSWMKVWSMAAWVVLSLPTSRNRLYGFCWCMPRKEGRDTWWRSRCILSA